MAEMTAEQATEWGKTLNFEQVWAALMENRKQQAEIQKQQLQTDKQIKELTKNIGGINNSLGRFMEQMFSPRVWSKFESLGYDFTKGGNYKFKESGQVLAEVDMFLENGEFTMPIEVKLDLTNDDVDEHLERIDKIRVYMDKHGDKRKLVGAVAGGIVPESVKRYAQKKGLYVLVQSGESVNVAEASKDFKAQEW
ncbi:hypothetical protein FACS1894200_10560 [Spirochaetia bacterium]|nr:hypothetical protein FACS1894200_10560 [Spirochaetia bacterium]